MAFTLFAYTFFFLHVFSNMTVSVPMSPGAPMMTTATPMGPVVVQQQPMKRPILTVMIGLLVCSLAVYALHTMSPKLGMLAMFLLILFLIVAMMYFSFESNASLVQRCLQIDKSRAFTMMAVSTIFVPAYPFVAMPLMLSSGVLLMMGRCMPY